MYSGNHFLALSNMSFISCLVTSSVSFTSGFFIVDSKLCIDTSINLLAGRSFHLSRLFRLFVEQARWVLVPSNIAILGGCLSPNFTLLNCSPHDKNWSILEKSKTCQSFHSMGLMSIYFVLFMILSMRSVRTCGIPSGQPPLIHSIAVFLSTSLIMSKYV